MVLAERQQRSDRGFGCSCGCFRVGSSRFSQSSVFSPFPWEEMAGVLAFWGAGWDQPGRGLSDSNYVRSEASSLVSVPSTTLTLLQTSSKPQTSSPWQIPPLSIVTRCLRFSRRADSRAAFYKRMAWGQASPGGAEQLSGAGALRCLRKNRLSARVVPS